MIDITRKTKADIKVGVLMTPDHYQKLRRIAEAWRRSTSDTLRQLVLEGYDRFFCAKNVPIVTKEASK